MTEVKAGMTDYSDFVFIPDPASTDGSGKTGLVAANLTVSFARMETDNDATVTDATSSLNDLAALTTAHNDWGLKEVSSTLAPGLYRIDFADAVFASGAWCAVVYVMITSSAAAASPMKFMLIPQSPIDGVLLAPTTHTSAVIPTVSAVSGAVGSVTGAVGSVTGAVGSVTGNVGGNVAGSVASVTAGVTVTTNNDKTGYALTSGERNSVADAVLDRDMSTGADSGSTTVRTIRQALRFLRNKWTVLAGTLTVYKEDDSTPSWTAAVTTDATAEPITANDPAGP